MPRARFIGEAYEQAGGTVLRDLFQSDDGGWLQDVALVDRLVAERLEREADAVRAEGWKWIEVAPEFPYGHTFGLRQLRGESVPLSAEEEAERDALQSEYDRLVDEHVGPDDLPDEIERRLSEIEERLAAINERPVTFDPAEIARLVRSSASTASAGCWSSAAMSGGRMSCRSNRRASRNQSRTPASRMILRSAAMRMKRKPSARCRCASKLTANRSMPSPRLIRIRRKKRIISPSPTG
jgi:hypothetical protein